VDKEEPNTFWKSFRSGSMNFLRILQVNMQYRAFSTIWLISLEKLSRCSSKFYYRYISLKKEVPVKFWKSSESAFQIQIRTSDLCQSHLGGGVHSPRSLVIVYYFVTLYLLDNVLDLSWLFITILYCIVWYGMVYANLCSTIVTNVSNALHTLVPGNCDT